MPNNYKPVVVTIYKNPKSVKQVEKELTLDLPLNNPPLIVNQPKNNKVKRGIEVVNLFGDEKI